MKITIVLLLFIFLFFPYLARADHIEEGTLEYLIVTNESTAHEEWYLLKKDGTRIELKGPIHGHTGKKIKAHGHFSNHAFIVHELLAADGSPSTAHDIPEALPDENLGDLRAAVIFIDFPDKPETSVTISQLRTDLKGIIEPYYTDVSDGKTHLTLDVFGKYTADINHICTTSAIVNAAIRAADPFVDFTQYQFVAVVSPTNCGYSGIAVLGRTNLTTADGIIRAGYSNTISTAGTLRSAQVMTHELGHNFRSHHSGFFQCSGPTLTPAFRDCTVIEYGNPYSVMGQAANVGEFDSAQKAYVGFWDEGIDYIDVTSPGRHTLLPHDTNNNGLRGLRIHRGVMNDLWVEARDSSFFQNLYPTADFSQGALLTVTSGKSLSSYRQAKPLLLDASGGSSPFSPALLPGQTFTDPATGATVTTVSRTPNELIVDVTPGTPDDTIPTAEFLQPTEWGVDVVKSGTVRLEVTASDDNLTFSEIYDPLNHSFLKICTSFPCIWDIDTTQLANRRQYFYFIAQDAVGNIGRDVIYFTIYNPPTTIPVVPSEVQATFLP